MIDLADHERRVLLTEDKDFGRLVFASHIDSAGVILIRFPDNARKTLVQAVRQLVQEQSGRLFNAFVVLERGYIRIRHKPNAQV